MISSNKINSTPIFNIIVLIIVVVVFSLSALSWSYYKFRLSNYGVVTQATVKTVSTYNVKGSTIYRLTAVFTDTHENTYLTHTIKTAVPVKIGDKITIVYDKYVPQRADLNDNKFTNDALNICWIAIFIFLVYALYKFYFD